MKIQKIHIGFLDVHGYALMKKFHYKPSIVQSVVIILFLEMK